MHLVVRQAMPTDFETVSRFCAHTELSSTRRRDAWDMLWTEGDPFGIVVSDIAGRESRRDLAIMVGCYITDNCVEELRCSPDPFALIKIDEMRKTGTSPFVRANEVGAKNAREGLNLLIGFLGWQGSASDGDPAPSIRALACHAFSDRHGGNRHRMILGEVCGSRYADLARRTGFSVINDYQPWSEKAPRDPEKHPFLVGVSREEALARENQWLTRLFTYFPPRFHFTEHQRQILLLAREGYTDNEIAETLAAKPDAIKKRWTGIYERVREIVPDLLPSNGANGRGQEKRRALLTHLRDRPEELRPYSRRGA